jgi:Arm DNA-binding domain
MGLGPYPVLTLERAREKAMDAHRLKADGRDPIDVRAAMRVAQQLEAANAITFKDAAEKYISAHKVA